MKTTALVLGGLLLASLGFAQKLTVPKAAQDDLSKRFASATGAEWEASSKGFEAEWSDGGKEIAVVYDATGKYLMTERQIDLANVPAKVVEGLKKQFPTAQLQEAESQEHADGKITYQVEFKDNGKSQEASFDRNGQALKAGADGSDGSDNAKKGTSGSDKGNKGSDGSDED